RNKGRVAAGATVATVLLLGTVGTLVGMMWALRAERMAREERDHAIASEHLATERLEQVTKEKERATRAERQAKEDAMIATAVKDFLKTDLLAEASPEKNPRNRQVSVEEVLGRAAARIPDKFANTPRIEAEIRQTVGDTYNYLGDYRSAQPHKERAYELFC